MNREHWEAMLPVIQAFIERKRIQIKYGNIWKDYIASDIAFTDGSKGYRIKPESKIVPLTFEDDLVGKVVIGQTQLKNKVKTLITQQSFEGVKVSGENWHTYEILLEQFIFPDGSPCGRVVE